MLGNGGDEVARREDLEPTEGRRPARTCRSEQSERQLELNLGVHAGMVDNGPFGVGAVGLRDLHVATPLRSVAALRAACLAFGSALDGKGAPDDVLGQALQILAFVGEYPPAAMHVESGMHPAAQHVGPRHRQQTLVHQKRDDPRPEHILQRLEAHIGQAVEQPRAGEEAVGDQSVEVGMEVQVLAEGVDRHDDAGQAVGQVQRGAQVFEQALVRQAAQVLEQVAVEAEVWPQHLGDTEGEMAVRDREQDRLGQERAEELDFLLVA